MNVNKKSSTDKLIRPKKQSLANNAPQNTKNKTPKAIRNRSNLNH